MATNVLFGTVLSLKLLLPYFDHFADSAELDAKPPFTEARVAKLFSFTNSPSVSVWLDGGHYRFFWLANITNHYMGRLSQFTDWKDSRASLDPEKDLEPLLKVPSLITEREALAIARRFLRRHGYDEDKLGVYPPEVRQIEFLNVDTGRAGKLPFFAVRFLPRFAPGGIDESLRLGIKMEISGITKCVVNFNQGFVRNEQIDLRTFAKPDKPPMPDSKKAAPIGEKSKQPNITKP